MARTWAMRSERTAAASTSGSARLSTLRSQPIRTASFCACASCTPKDAAPPLRVGAFSDQAVSGLAGGTEPTGLSPSAECTFDCACRTLRARTRTHQQAASASAQKFGGARREKKKSTAQKKGCGEDWAAAHREAARAASCSISCRCCAKLLLPRITGTALAKKWGWQARHGGGKGAASSHARSLSERQGGAPGVRPTRYPGESTPRPRRLPLGSL
jgi:hypothetical protein